VESLNTNPEGKIYPVLTHGRQTDVHVQLAHVARQVYLDTLEQGSRRLDEIRLGQSREKEHRQSAFIERRAALAPGCLVCGRPLVSHERVEAAAILPSARISGRPVSSRSNALPDWLSVISTGPTHRRTGDPLWDLFRESAQRSYFVLRRAPHTRNFYQQQISFYRFDEEGLEVSHKTIELQSSNGACSARNVPTSSPCSSGLFWAPTAN